MKQDRKLVASTQDYEIDYIVKKLNTTREVVETTMYFLGKNGKPCRSRKMIYKAIRDLQSIDLGGSDHKDNIIPTTE